MEVGGWVQVSLGIFFFENPKIALNQYRYFGVVYHKCILSVYTLLKVVSYYNLSVLSMSVMGFQKKSLDGGGWVGWALSKFFWIFFNFAKPRIEIPPTYFLIMFGKTINNTFPRA